MPPGALDPSMGYYNPGGALSFGSPPPATAAGFAGYGLDPQTMAMLYGTPGPQSPYSKKLDEASAQVLGDPSAIGGALSNSQGKYDSAVQDKLTAIKRASDLISGTSGTSNTPLMKFAAGLSSSPWIGTALGNAFGSSADEINKQREMERLIAEKTGNLGIEGADTEMGAALEDQGATEKKLSIAGQLENQAGNIQNRADIANSRNRQSLLQYAGRISAAEIAADKNRYDIKGLTQDGQNSVVLDKTTGETKLGPPIQLKSGGAGGGNVSQWKYNMWLAAHPGDNAGALDFVAGHKKMSPQDQYKYARSEAAKELGTGADEQDIVDLTGKIVTSMSGAGGASSSAPPAGHAAPAGNAPPGGTSAYTQTNPAHPLSHDDFNKLPPEAFFVNPADGKVMQKK